MILFLKLFVVVITIILILPFLFLYKNRNIKANKWQMFLYFCKKNKKFNREKLLKFFNENKNEYSTFESYRCILQKAGYIDFNKEILTKNGKQKLGNFVIIKDIPKNLSYRQARREAYGK